MKNSVPFRFVAMGAMLCLTAGSVAAPVFTPNNQPTGWVAEMEVSNFRVTGGTESVYKAQYQRATWLGDLIAYPITVTGRVDYATPRWTPTLASTVTAQNWDTGRRIGTMKSDGSKIPLLWASLGATQQTLLTTAAAPAGANLIAFLRGDRSNEAPTGGYRNRGATTLGDIVHSRPAFASYTTGEKRIFVGANDGMLHAFDAANTGASAATEVFAYAPSMLMATIGNLKANPYSHQYLVDASPNVRDVKLSGVDKKVLVSGLGAGGKGLFALDVTSPTAATDQAAADKALWEITPSTVNNVTDASYADLGHTYGVPLIFKANTGNWVAVAANGYNSANGAAVLYVINLSTGALIRKIDTGATGTAANPNGLSSPVAVDIDQNGTADYVYAGDIDGNLWKFDLSSASPASWSSSKLVATSPARAITGAPGVSLHPLGGIMVVAGTGRLFTAADAADVSSDYVYGVWDKPGASGSVPLSVLVDQTLTAKTYTSGAITTSVRVSSSNSVDYGTQRGWRLTLPAGERLVGDGGFTINSRFSFTGTNPTVTNTAPQTPGVNWQNEVDHLTGGGGTTPAFDLSGDGLLTDSDRVTASSGAGPQAGPTGIPVSRYLGQGLFSQPIIAQLASLNIALYNTNPDLAPPPVPPPTTGGVANGHFDFDLYYGGCVPGVGLYKATCNQSTHVHEYDDKYNVTGVNMLAPSLLAFDLANPIPSTSTSFKVLVANQKLSPAVYLGVGSGVPKNVRNVNTTNGLTVAALPTYTRADVDKFYFTMPLDAFASKDWAGDGIIRAGLVPTQTGCVQRGTGAITLVGGVPTVTGVWMNGALTFQVIKGTTPQSAIELNVASDPSMGYRLKIDAVSQSYQLAQYTTFWHHPNGQCLTDAGWVANPPQDLSGAASQIASDNPIACDPLAVARTCTPPAPGTPYSIEGSTTVAAVAIGAPPPSGSGSSTTTTFFADGSSITTTVTRNTDGTITVTTSSTVPTSSTFSAVGPCPGPTCGCPGPSCGCPGPNCPCQGPQCTEAAEKIKAGRLSWRQLLRQ